ncbi:MAG: sulfotransferase domain-containing protein [Actinomycetota bacterium]
MPRTTPTPAGGRLPSFLIIGAPKAGTTTLAAYLDAHPDVFVAREKEVHYFDTNFSRGLDWYRSRFIGAMSERAVGEASPTYMYATQRLERIAATLPKARLIAVLRDPVDRAYSHYWWQHAIGESRSFEDAVRAEMRGEWHEGRPKRYLDGGRYRRYLEDVGRYFPRDALHVVTLEDLRREPAQTFSEVCRFLGVDGSFVPPNLGEVRNPAYRLRSPRLRRLMFRTRAWRRLPSGVAERIDAWNRVPFRYPDLDPALRSELRAWFADADAELAGWLGRPLPWRQPA